MKKLKCVFIDMIDDRMSRVVGQEELLPPYSTFQEYSFDQKIGSRVRELFGWATDLENQKSVSGFEVSLHIITSHFLQKHGVAQHFYSPHGPKFDDKYSYLHGMNLLMIEGYNRVHLIYTIRRISKFFQEKLLTSDSKKKRYSYPKGIDSFLVPVDRPRLGILTPTSNLNAALVKRIEKFREEVVISDDIQILTSNIHPDDFIDYSLSRNYQYILDDYVPLLNSILEVI
jgi:hypothetical protein